MPDYDKKVTADQSQSFTLMISKDVVLGQWCLSRANILKTVLNVAVPQI